MPLETRNPFEFWVAIGRALDCKLFDVSTQEMVINMNVSIKVGRKLGECFSWVLLLALNFNPRLSTDADFGL